MNDSVVREWFLEEMCDVLMYYSDVLNRFNENMSRNFIKHHQDS